MRHEKLTIPYNQNVVWGQTVDSRTMTQNQGLSHLKVENWETTKMHHGKEVGNDNFLVYTGPEWQTEWSWRFGTPKYLVWKPRPNLPNLIQIDGTKLGHNLPSDHCSENLSYSQCHWKGIWIFCHSNQMIENIKQHNMSWYYLDTI